MDVSEFTALVGKTEKLSGQQVRNLKKIQNISDKFHKDAGIKPVTNKIAEDTIVLESGHQPNFLPHSGLFKKVFMLDFLKKKLEEKGKSCVAVFGFADYNLASAHLLYKNRVPALNRNGFQKVGFSVPKDKWKAFSAIQKPSAKDLENELDEIRDFYINSAKSIKYPENKVRENLKTFEILIKDSYNKARNFPDMNAFFIAKLCTSFGFDVNFFRYSDLQKGDIFIEEWAKIIGSLKEFNKIYVSSLKRNDVDINYDENSLPFWYHCDCGVIVPMSVDSFDGMMIHGKCQSCNEGYRFILDEKELKRRFARMSMNAVSRNIILAEGTGTGLFVSGVGGSLAYGRISDEIAEKLKLKRPLTAAWKSRDYLAGINHMSIVRDFTGSLGIIMEDVLGKKASVAIKGKLNRLESGMKGANESDKQFFRTRNEHSMILSKLKNTSFSMGIRPSIIEMTISLGPGKSIPMEWKNSFSAADMVKENGFYIATGDTIYQVPGEFAFIEKEQLAPLYEGIVSLGRIADKSREGK